MICSIARAARNAGCAVCFYLAAELVPTGCASITGEAPPPGPRRLIVEYLTPKIRAMSIKVSPA